MQLKSVNRETRIWEAARLEQGFGFSLQDGTPRIHPEFVVGTRRVHPEFAAHVTYL